jgi:hypothetical protein
MWNKVSNGVLLALPKAGCYNGRTGEIMSDLAPWESGNEPSAEQRKKTSVIQKAYKLPSDDELPDIYKPEADDFVAPGGKVVPRPPVEPRAPEPKGMQALITLGVLDSMAVMVILLGFVFMPEDLGVVGTIVGVVGILMAVAVSGVLILEVPRMSAYQKKPFFPAILVYGSREQFEKVVGPGGISVLLTPQIIGTGAGPLNKVFDRSAHIASPPEVVGLHCDRGMGPEIVSIAWNAVDDLKRGDVVWLAKQSSNRYLMFHKLIPYAPGVVTDANTRKEVMTVLKVGTKLYKDAPVRKDMGTSKVLNTDADGKVVVSGNPGQQPQTEPQTGGPPGLGGRRESDFQQPDGEQPPLKLSEPGANLGGFNNDDQGDDDPSRPQS